MRLNSLDNKVSKGQHQAKRASDDGIKMKLVQPGFGLVFADLHFL